MVSEEVGGEVLPWAIWDVSRYHGLCYLCCFMVGTYGATFDLICYVWIKVRPVNC